LTHGAVPLSHLDETQVALVGRASVIEILREHCTEGEVVFAVYPNLLQTYRFLAGIQVERFGDYAADQYYKGLQHNVTY
jgi:hypothetical protein